MLQKLIRTQRMKFSSTPLVQSLHEFFDSTKGHTWRDKELLTGRAWKAAELRVKSFEDLHELWWNCIKEVNKLETQKQEARRFKLFFNNKSRLGLTKQTMSRIKFVLWERRIAYLQAKRILQTVEDQKKADPEEIAQVGRKETRKTAGRKRKVDRRATSWTIV